MDTISVLIVEDNANDTILIKEHLIEGPGNRYQIEEAETLADALEIISRGGIDVVLLDLSLPDSFGLDTVRTVVTNFPKMVIIILTGLQDEQMALQAVRYGAQDYLEKNRISHFLLHRSISYSIERKKAMQEKENLLFDLSKALEQIEALQAILPICAICKKIHDDNNEWLTIEEYIKSRSNTELIHGVCPDCLKQHYQDIKSYLKTNELPSSSKTS